MHAYKFSYEFSFDLDEQIPLKMSMLFVNVFFVFLLLICSGGISARNIARRSLYPSVKSIVSSDGDIIDCVDMYKQPSLQDPRLKNHTLQLRPTKIPNVEGQHVGMEQKQPQQCWQKSGDCPDGTIPIIRSTTNVKDLISTDSKDSNKNNAPQHKQMLDYSSHNINVAVGYIYDFDEGPFYGGVASLSVWNISVNKEEYSKNYVLAADCNGDSSSTLDNMDILNFVAAGWIVDHSTFGDKHSRLYAEWRANDTGCYNMFCSGFVQISKNVALGATLSPVSVYDDPDDVRELEVHIYMDIDQHNWWLDIGNEIVGYWPKEIFKDFLTAPAIVFGGEILNKAQNGNHTTTQMGNGHLPSNLDQYGKVADMNKIIVRTSDNLYHNHTLQYFATYSNCYSYFPGGDAIGGNGGLLYYGGPGGVSCDQ